VELTPLGEIRVEDDSLARALRADLHVGSDFPVFIPATTYIRGHRRTTIRLLEGYAFVGSGLPDTMYFQLENRSYVERVMSVQTGPYKIRTISTIPNISIESLRKQLQDELGSIVAVGDRIRITEGSYKALEGLVQGRDEENAYIQIELRSMKIVATIPLAFIEPVSDEEDNGVDIRVTSYVRYAGYLSWTAVQDKALKGLFKEAESIDVWYDDIFLGSKQLVWKKRRLFLGKPVLAKLPEGKTFFNISRKPDGAFIVRSR